MELLPHLTSNCVHLVGLLAVWKAIQPHELLSNVFCLFCFSTFKVSILIKCAVHVRVISRSVVHLCFNDTIHNAKWQLLEDTFKKCAYESSEKLDTKTSKKPTLLHEVEWYSEQ